MLTPVVLLPLAAVLINDVKTEPANGALAIDIATSDPVATSAVRVMTGGPRRLYVYLDDSAARRPSFGEAPMAVVAHARLRYTKLEVPTSERCGEPFGVVAVDGGVRVRATCKQGLPVAETAAAPSRAPATVQASAPNAGSDWLARQAVSARDKGSEASLRVALALPENAADEAAGEGAAEASPEASKPAPAAEQAGEGDKKVPRKVEKPAVAAAAPVHGETPDAPAAVANLSNGTGQDSPGPAGKNPGGEPRSLVGALVTVVAMVLLLGGGAVVLLLARRRGGRERMIRILESASIGPRRSLVVARVGGRTMVLGVSEAGVALLDSPPTSPLPASGEGSSSPGGEDAALGLRHLASAMAPGPEAAEAAEASAAAAKPDGSLLTRLFRRKSREAEGLGAEDFHHLFAESLEDEDLRRKLALGEPGRVA